MQQSQKKVESKKQLKTPQQYCMKTGKVIKVFKEGIFPSRDGF